MKKLVCCFAILCFTPGFSQSSVSHASALKNRLSGNEQAHQKQAAIVSLKDSTHYSNWDVNTMQWTAPARILYSYNTAGKENGYFDVTYGMRRVNYSFDANDNLLGFEGQTQNPGWATSYKTTYTYDNANNRLTEFSQAWIAATNSWKNTASVTNTYDANHNLLTSVRQSWDINTSSWKNLTRETATYNTNNEYTSDVYEGWNSGTSAWENFRRYQFTYANGDLTGLVEEVYDSNTSMYMAIEKQSNTYDGNHLLLESISQKPNPNTMAWENSERTTYTYDTQNHRISYVIDRWDSGTNTWEKTFRLFDYYSNKTVGLRTYAGQEENIGLYPNPATDNISILNETGISYTSLSIMDVNGKEVLTQTIDHGTMINISLNTLPQGVYMLELKSESGPVYKKFMKN